MFQYLVVKSVQVTLTHVPNHTGLKSLLLKIIYLLDHLVYLL